MNTEIKELKKRIERLEALLLPPRKPTEEEIQEAILDGDIDLALEMVRARRVHHE